MGRRRRGLLGAAPAALAQEAAIEWDALNKNIFEHYRTGDYDRAIVAAKKALEIAEDNVGPDHPKVATSLNNLAFIYNKQGQYTQAEPLYRAVFAKNGTCSGHAV